jgi:RNA polymerase sigma-70 factor (ECF subfamily)
VTERFDDLFRQSSAQIVATLTRILGPRNIALAEEVAQDALVKALQTWPHEGVPANPSAWLIQVAKRGALDVLRRERWLVDRAETIAAWLKTHTPQDLRYAGFAGVLALPEDDRLAMMLLARQQLTLHRGGRRGRGD